MTHWRTDVLGPRFSCTDIDLGSDAEGPLVATLVRSLPPERTALHRIFGSDRPLEDVDVLYVHGWSDYFFQRSLADFWTSRGARFFALDLRKYGRSLRDGQTKGYIEDLSEYDAEIDRSLQIIREDRDRPRRLILLGHSTGGLVLSLWAGRHPGDADAIILNSPWLEFQLSAHGRQMISPLVGLGARLNPREVAPQLDFGFYTRAQREVGPKDEISVVNTDWRSEQTSAVRAGWLRAVLDGHDQVSRGLAIEAPILVLLSLRFAVPLRWSDDLTRADTVLEVDDIAKTSLHLGSSVTIERIDGALHDVFLSAPDAREDAYRRLERWTTGWHAAVMPTR